MNQLKLNSSWKMRDLTWFMKMDFTVNLTAVNT